MSDLALYRKYRSSGFEEVLGQPHIVATLTSAIARGNVSHAYLFSGPRGVGKTSVARLLSRSLNCTGQTKPCNKCRHCLEANTGAIDMLEIDAASNRGIDEIRELRDKVAIAPAIGKYKVYIIDEVHMLTDPAFNALLKTLEEPPKHVVFILATTSAHKIPATIISRTQHFVFRPIPVSVLVNRLEAIAASERISIDEAATLIIATRSNGGFRDAISMLDQLASSGKKSITAQDVNELLGLASPELIVRLSIALSTSNIKDCLAVLDELKLSGLDMAQLSQQLINDLRIQVAKSIKDDVSAHIIQKQLLAINQISQATKSKWPEIAFEVAILNLCLDTEQTQSSTPSIKVAAELQPSKQTVELPKKQTAPELPASHQDQDNEEKWLKALAVIKLANNSLYALLKSCVITHGQDNLIVTCRFNFHRDRLEESKNRLLIEKGLLQVYSRKLKLVVQVNRNSELTPSIDQDFELVSSALEILGGEVVYE